MAPLFISKQEEVTFTNKYIWDYFKNFNKKPFSSCFYLYVDTYNFLYEIIFSEKKKRKTATNFRFSTTRNQEMLNDTSYSIYNTDTAMLRELSMDFFSKKDHFFKLKTLIRYTSFLLIYICYFSCFCWDYLLTSFYIKIYYLLQLEK